MEDLAFKKRKKGRIIKGAVRRLWGLSANTIFLF